MPFLTRHFQNLKYINFLKSLPDPHIIPYYQLLSYFLVSFHIKNASYIMRKSTNNKVLMKMWRKGNLHTLLAGMQIGVATMKNSMEVSQKLKTELPSDSAIPQLGTYPGKMIQNDTCTPAFTAALFLTANMRKQPKWPSTSEQMNKMWPIHTVEYYSAMKENETMSFAATWTNLEITILSEGSQMEKDKCHEMPLICRI